MKSEKILLSQSHEMSPEKLLEFFFYFVELSHNFTFNIYINVMLGHIVSFIQIDFSLEVEN